MQEPNPPHGALSGATERAAVVSPKGAKRWTAGHPWIYRSDVVRRPAGDAGAVLVESHLGKPLGWALWSPKSEIALRLLDNDPSATINREWWSKTLASVLAWRQGLERDSNAFRLVHGEADGCPSLICDLYDRWLVVQLLSAGLETFRAETVDALRDLTGVEGILARNDVPVRGKEGLPRGVELLYGDVPKEIVVRENDVKYIAAPWDGQKTGAFLDQRENRALIGSLARGRALDCFSYHGSFALHLAARAEEVIAVDSSGPALERAAANAALNGFTNVETVEADVFDELRRLVAANDRFDTVVLDPPAFAKTRASVPAALRGYGEINRQAMRLLATGGMLFTASCSFHLSRALFLEMIAKAAADSGRRIAVRAITGQPRDHPEIATIPESGYLKGVLLQALD